MKAYMVVLKRQAIPSLSHLSGIEENIGISQVAVSNVKQRKLLPQNRWLSRFLQLLWDVTRTMIMYHLWTGHYSGKYPDLNTGCRLLAV
jgi:hypothetical protein